MTKRFTINIYGCQMNYADSSRIKFLLESIGLKYVSSSHKADIVIFDTCSVRQKAEDKISGKLKTIPKDTKIWITGCLPSHRLNINKMKKLNPKLSNQIKTNFPKGNFVPPSNINHPKIIGTESLNHSKEQEKLKNIKDIQKAIFINYSFGGFRSTLKGSFKNLELFFRIDDLPYLPYILKQIGYKNISLPKSRTLNYCNLNSQSANFKLSKKEKTSMIPIQTGCSQFCSYCIVPFARGLEKNRSVKNIIQEVKKQTQNGAKEIVLIGQIVNKHPQFTDILKRIIKIKGVEQIRYTSPYPNYYNQDLIDLHKNPKISPHIHLPVQSGSDKILTKMNRGYNIKQYKNIIHQIKKLKRTISISTDIIVGFPGETENDFKQTIDLVKNINFNMIYIAKYSPRPGTTGAKKYKDSISTQIKKERFHKLTNLLKTQVKEKNNNLIGKTKKIIIDQVGKNHISGRTLQQTKTTLKYEPKDRNKIKNKFFIKGKITKVDGFGIKGNVLIPQNTN